MKFCPNHKYEPSSTRPEATVTVWCPTWINSWEGPQMFCEKCSQNFQPEFNPGAAGGDFRWGENAWEAFRSVQIIRQDDPRFGNAWGMVRSGTHMAGCNYIGFLSYGVWIVDGRAWLATRWAMTDLGEQAEARENWPELFAMPKKEK